MNSTSLYMTTTTAATAATPVGGSIVWIFSEAYKPIHGWLSTFVCLFGIPANLLNIIVLTRPNLISSPTNLILTALAVSDLLTMLTSLVNTIYYNIIYVHVPSNPPSPVRDTKFWVYFTQIHVMASVTFHSISIWLTVYLACFRYIYIASSSPGSLKSLSVRKTNNNNTNNNAKSSSYRSNSQFPKKTSIVYFFRRFLLRCRTYNFTLCGILNVCLFCIIFCSPAYMYPRVEVFNDTSVFNLSLADPGQNLSHPENIKYPYHLTNSDLDKQTDGLIFTIMFYTQAIFGKFLPCLLLVTFSSLLVHSLIIINRNNKKLIKTDSSGKAKATSKTFLNNIATTSKNSSPNKNGAAVFKIDETKKHEEQVAMLNASKPDSSQQAKNELYASENPSRLNQKRGSLSVLITDQSRRFTRRLSEIRMMTRHFNQPLDQRRSVDRAAMAAAAVVTAPTVAGAAAANSGMSPRKSIMTNVSTIKKPKRNKAKENLRTTLMLTIVCVLFLITEFPQSIIIFLSIIKGKDFYANVYMPLGDLFDTVALTNNSINFFLYCAMSRAFRNTFYNTMVSLWCCKFYKRFFVKESSVNSCRPRRPTNLNSANFSLFTATACGQNNLGGSKPSSKNLANSGGKADLIAGANQIEAKSAGGKSEAVAVPSVHDVVEDGQLMPEMLVNSSSGYYNPDDERSGFLAAASLSMAENSAIRKSVVNFKYEHDYDDECDDDDEDNEEEGDYDENEI